MDFIISQRLFFAFFFLLNCVEAKIKKFYSTLQRLTIKIFITRGFLKLMELTADQVLNMLKNLLVEEILRDHLIGEVSTVEI